MDDRVDRIAKTYIALSNLGRKGYLAYWSASICREILSSTQKSFTVQAIVDNTWILPEDVIATLKEMDVVEPQEMPGGSAVIERSRVENWSAENRIAIKAVVQRSGFLLGLNGGDGVQ